MAEVAASFRIEIEAMSFGLTRSIVLGTPSTRQSGLESLKVETPRTKIEVWSAPGCPERWILVMPGSLPVIMFETLVIGALSSSLFETCETEPTRNCFFCVP